jgi:hypothetical protein
MRTSTNNQQNINQRKNSITQSKGGSLFNDLGNQGQPSSFLNTNNATP